MITLREARDRRGIKAQAVAEHIGVSRQTYSKYENKPWLMTVQQASAACDFIGCQMADIFFGDEVNLIDAEKS